MVQTTLEIDGMMCGMCEAHINDAIRRHFAVKSVKSNRKKRQCVIVSDEPLDEDCLRVVIAETGYDLRSIELTSYQKKGLFSR